MSTRVLLPAVAFLALASAAPLVAQKQQKPAAGKPGGADSVRTAEYDCADMCPPAIVNAREFEREITRQYPPLLRDAGISGRVVVALVVDTFGTVMPDSSRVVESDHPQFSAAALRVISKLRFSPARLRGRAVRVPLEVPLTFGVNAPRGNAPVAP
jgi:TonB family protein